MRGAGNRSGKAKATGTAWCKQERACQGQACARQDAQQSGGKKPLVVR